MIQYNGRPVQGFALGGNDAERLLAAFSEIVDSIETLRRSLTPRESLILQLGLAASHLEESAVQGHSTRAKAHAENVAKLIEQLKKPPVARGA